MSKKPTQDHLSEKPGRFGSQSGAQLHFDEKAQSQSKISRQSVTIIFLISLCVILGLTIHRMLPLKTVAIYRMEVDKLGNEQVTKMSVAAYEPSLNEIRARLKDITVKMFEIKPRELRQSMTFVHQFMSGQASRQFDEFINTEKMFSRAAENSSLLREVEVSGVNRITDKVMLIDFITKERIGTGSPSIKRKTLTTSYEIKPAQTDEEVLGSNPAGIYIVSFTIADTVSSAQ